MTPANTASHLSGMGALPHEQGVAFRVWAPNATRVAVIGAFNNWSPDADPMEREENGYWYANVPRARVGQEYRYQIVNGAQTLSRVDPYARQVTNSIGNGVIHDPHYDWKGDSFHLPPWRPGQAPTTAWAITANSVSLVTPC